MSDIISAFIDSMTRDGCQPASAAEIIADGDDHIVTLHGDKKPGRLGYCLTVFSDGYARGNYINFKTSDKGRWNSYQDNKTISKEEKDAIEARNKRHDAERKERKEKRYLAAAELAKKAWEESSPCIHHPYLAKKGVKSHGLRITKDGKIIIPLSQKDGICAYQTIDSDGEKYYQVDGRKNGSYFKIGDDTDTICICEGYATGASIHEATGFVTYCAMDAGNLVEVTGAIRKLHPEANIIICADNDQWTVNQKKQLSNTGLKAAQQAATKFGAFEVHPDFPADDIDLRKDFNDLHLASGLEAVRDKIMMVVNTQPKKEDKPEIPPEYYVPAVLDNGDIDLTGDMGLPFKILGYSEGVYYYFPFGLQQIFGLAATAHSMNNLIQLASLDEWRNWAKTNFSWTLTAKELPTYAFDTMKRIAEKRGVFSVDDRVRGCGAWMDAGRVILHCGDKLIVDGKMVSPSELCGYYVYAAAGQRFKHNAEPLSDKEAQALRKICEMPTWESPLSGLLLAGWLVVAPICAALEWRPHIWLRGEAGSGKSTILNQIIRRVLHNISFNVSGGTTESSIREGLGYDARPIIYDEAEGNGNKPSLMDGVLALAKNSSSDVGAVGKRGQKRFTAKSSFCFSSIHPPLKDFAAETRISMLDLKRNTSSTAQKDFEALENAINDVLTQSYGRRMLARTVKHLPTLLTNIKTFKKAATNVIKNARAADQVSAMLGGLYMLSSTNLITLEEAQKWIAERDWTQHTTVGEENEQERLLHYISTSVVTVKSEKGNKDFTMGTLIAAAMNKSSEVSAETAKNTLRLYSICVKGDGVIFGNKNKNMEKLLGDTAWYSNCSKTLKRIAGAKDVSKHYFGPGDNQRGVKLPASLFFDDMPAYVPPDDEEIPFE